MCNCSAWCMIARRVSKPNICRLRILHCLCQHGCEPKIFMFPRLPCVCIHLECGQRSRCTHTMRARTCVSVVVCVARKLRPCPSYSGRRDRNNSVHWRSLYKGGGGTNDGAIVSSKSILEPTQNIVWLRKLLHFSRDGGGVQPQGPGWTTLVGLWLRAAVLPLTRKHAK